MSVGGIGDGIIKNQAPIITRDYRSLIYFAEPIHESLRGVGYSYPKIRGYALVKLAISASL